MTAYNISDHNTAVQLLTKPHDISFSIIIMQGVVVRQEGVYVPTLRISL